MALARGYGVVLGTVHRYYRDPVNDYGQYFHGNLVVQAPAGRYHCAIDIDSKFLPDGVMWKVVELRLPLAQGLDALADLEPLVSAARRVFVYGEPFRQPDLGVHKIHQNQGDPLGSRWSAENGIWQDGATVVQREDGSYGAFCNKFRTQSDRTDDDGRPVEGSDSGRIDASTSVGAPTDDSVGPGVSNAADTPTSKGDHPWAPASTPT